MDTSIRTSRRRDRRRARRARGRRPPARSRDRAAGLRGRRRRRRERARVGARAGVLAVGVQRRPGRERAARRARAGRARPGRATRRAPRSSSATSSRSPRCRRSPSALHLGARVVGVAQARARQAQGRRAATRRRSSSSSSEDGERAPLPRTRGHRRLRHVDAAEPARRGRAAAAGERAHADRIAYGIPDVLGADRDRYAGRRVLVVGSGHSAFNAILDLVALRDSEPATEIVWAIRGGAPGRKYGGGGDDQLPARGALGNAVRALVEDGSVALDRRLPDPRGRRRRRRPARARRRRARARRPTR